MHIAVTVIQTCKSARTSDAVKYCRDFVGESPRRFFDRRRVS